LVKYFKPLWSSGAFAYISISIWFHIGTATFPGADAYFHKKTRAGACSSTLSLTLTTSTLTYHLLSV